MLEMLNDYEGRNYTHPRAALSENTRKRQRPLDKDNFRTEYQRDVHRIIYSQPFRRLRHKTQVFFLTINDHVCTRLEHSIYVAYASRTVARSLGLNEDLSEAIGLGHDIGHAPFGHHGEAVLTKIAKEYGIQEVFHHEVNSLKVVDELTILDGESEKGLNLTYEVRDGIVSHCGEKFERELIPGKNEKNLSGIHKRNDAGFPSTLEGCVVRMVDKIAYVGRDLEDGIEANLIETNDIPTDFKMTLGRDNGEIVGNLIMDLIRESSKYEDRICLSKEKHQALVDLKDFNYEKIYKHSRVEYFKKQAENALEALFSHLLKEIKRTNRFESEEPNVHVFKWLDRFIKEMEYKEEARDEAIVFNFISGMTDNFVLRCIDDIFKPKPIV
jgi:dGTPase